MNKIVLLGKLIKDPELKTIENGEKVFTRFIIAVDSRWNKKGRFNTSNYMGKKS